MLNNKNTLNEIRADILAALEAVGDIHGTDFKFKGNLSYDEHGDFFNIKLECTRRGAESPALKTWKEDAYLYDCRPEWSEHVVDSDKGPLQIVGLNHNARKYPVLVKHLDDGKTYKHTVESVIKTWGNPPAPNADALETYRAKLKEVQGE